MLYRALKSSILSLGCSVCLVAAVTAPARAQGDVDFSVSKAANVMYNSVYAVVAYPGIAKPVKNYPTNISGAMIDNDVEWVASNRMRLLKEWQQRYDSKSLPK